MKIIRVGTRESLLALAQTHIVLQEIQKKHPDIQFEVIKMKTKGDMILDRRLDKIGGKGLFIKELEQALLCEEIDMAVHSLKDMPAVLTEGLCLAAISQREDPRDVLVSRLGVRLEELPGGSIIGTGSRRRELQLQKLRPDCVIQNLRGNVNTRLDKLYRGEYDAIVLAKAGLYRLGLQDKITMEFDPEVFIPAVGQGVLAIETRIDADVSFLKDSVHCKKTYIETTAERSFLRYLNGGCSIPVGAYAIMHDQGIKIHGFLADENNRSYKTSLQGDADQAELLGEKLAKHMLLLQHRNGAKYES